MTELKRYDFEIVGADADEERIVEVEDARGEWVAYSDYSAKCAETDRLIEALEKYGSHLPDCVSLEPNDVNGTPKSCSCGFPEMKEGI